MPSPPFAELCAATNFSFLRGASHPEELVAQASNLNLRGLGIADRNSLAGVVRAYLFRRLNEENSASLKVVSGTRLVFCDGTPDILVYPRDRDAYGRLCRLLTRGNLRAKKGTCLLTLEDLRDHSAGQQLIVMPASTREGEDGATFVDKQYADFKDLGSDRTRIAGAALKDPEMMRLLADLSAAAPGRVWLAAIMAYGRSMRGDLARRVRLAEAAGVPLLATNDVTMHVPERRALGDVITCIRLGLTLDTAGKRLAANAERHLKDGAEMARLFAEAPDAIVQTQAFLDGITFSLDELRGPYPEELREGFATPQIALEHFAREGAKLRYSKDRYPDGIPASVLASIDHELKLVADLDYAPYFLTVHDLVRFARKEKILCQGRGSAANSTLCYCLGITDVDPTTHSLLFERFISSERAEPPDIDVDFEHERREEVMQYIYHRYGRARTGLTATVVTYRTRSSIREVGKVFGLSGDAVSLLSSTAWGYGSGRIEERETRRAGLDPSEPRLARAIELAGELAGFPRHLSQHTGGFVITRTRLDEIVPIANASMDGRTTIEWDKDDLDALKILKVDVLALGMLTCLQKGFGLLAQHYGQVLTLASLPAEERCVYAMIQRADTIGVFQIESRAQMSMLPRLKPNKFYDLVIEVAIVRPGPIQGDMVHPYLRRREKKELPEYPSEELKNVLEKTLGVPLFQEQAMQIAIVAAGFSPGEADQLRRAMATFKRVGTIGNFYDKMVEGMVARDYPREFAERCFKQIEGFGTYGFPESHAASFALLVYASAWMKCRYPDVFACALLNAQPMGFYAPAQIVRDAIDHGVEIDEIDVSFSDWDATLHPLDGAFDPSRLHRRHAEMAGDILTAHRLRLGFRQAKGLREEEMKVLVDKRGAGYDSIRDLWLRTALPPSTLEHLASADAFRSFGLDRRDAAWAVRGLNRSGDKDDLPLLRDLSFSALEPEAHLPPMPLGAHVVEDYRHISLSLKAHPVVFVRDRLNAKHVVRNGDLDQVQPGRRITVAGLVLVRQRPGSAKGTIFLTIEDETGVANVIVWPKVFEVLRPVVLGGRFIAISGRLQRESTVMHVVAERAEDYTSWLAGLSNGTGEIGGLARADEVRRPILEPRPKRPKHADELPDLFGVVPSATGDVRGVLPKGRNFQ
jgi:error-prone DNA polymerase